MANEWTVVELFGENRDGDQISYTCASGTAIAKGTLLTLTDPFTVSIATAPYQPIAGVAAMDKSGTDFSTKISVWTNGIFNAKASGAIVVGAPLQCGAVGVYTNYVLSASPQGVTAASGAAILGYSRETASAGETFNVRLTL